MRITGEAAINTTSGITKLKGVFKVSKQGGLVYIQHIEEPQRHKDKWGGRWVPTNRFNYLDSNENVDVDEDAL